MKLNKIYEELLDTAKNLGITVRKDKGHFKTGFCTIDKQELIVINRSAPLEQCVTVLSRCLSQHSNNIYLKPAVRDFIENEVRRN
ncbi:MAG TPA: hypothetical protein PKY56_02330 [Candidatus Kapabacteria bacterium]|nr:hypothetical protein [Candidatus Kapabacteria bacterium]HPO61701.1 hypothetical protein [Candidatus Kapabacteria bacterium]